MFSSSSLVKLILFEKPKTGKTNKNITNTEEPSTVAAMSSAILLFKCCWKLINFINVFVKVRKFIDFVFRHFRQDALNLTKRFNKVC